jgi:hypothetical protein
VLRGTPSASYWKSVNIGGRPSRLGFNKWQPAQLALSGGALRYGPHAGYADATALNHSGVKLWSGVAFAAVIGG